MTPTPPPKPANGQVESHIRFESMVASICSALANARPHNIDDLMIDSLRRIAETLGGNRVLLGQTDEQSGELVARSQYYRNGPPFPERLSISDLNPALWRTLVAGEVSNVPDVSALPDSASIDRQYFMQIDLRSYLAVPVLIDGSLRFMLAVGSAGETRIWPADAVPQLRVLAEVLASALLRCEAEKIVQASEQLFRAFVEHAPIPIMLAPGPDHTPLYFNPAFTRLFGYSRKEVPTPSAWWPLAYPNLHYRADRIHAWDHLVAEGESSGLLQEATEAEILAKDGSTRFSQIRLALIRGYKLIFFNDLTARRQAEAALRLTQYAVDHNPVMIFRIDPAGRFIYANQASCHQFGFSIAELLTKSIWDVSATLSADEWPQRAATLREQGGLSLESVYRRRDGATFPVEIHMHFTHFSGEGSFFCFALDISVRRAAQEAAHSHFRRIQALASQLSQSEELQRRELARVLHDEIGQNLFAVTTQLVALKSRLNGEGETLAKVLSLLDDIARDTRELTFELYPPVLYQLGLGPALQRLIDQSAKRHPIAFTLTGGGVGPADLNVRGLVYHAVRELLNNVVKHARASHAALSVTEDGPWLRICLQDNGIGYNAPKAAAQEGGFGLFYLRERIELLGGSLTIDSPAGQGCRVAIDLPLDASKAK